jgi:hypothetical protein
MVGFGRNCCIGFMGDSLPDYILPYVTVMCVVYSIFMLCGVVGRVGNVSICKSRFPVDGYYYIMCSFLYENI